MTQTNNYTLLEHARDSGHMISVTWKDITEIGRVKKDLVDGLIKDNNVDSLMEIYETFGKIHYLDKSTIIIKHEEGSDDIDGVVIPLSQIINVTYYKSN